MSSRKNYRQNCWCQKITRQFHILILLVCALGCSPERAAPVNATLAKSTLIDVLDTWKSGGAIEDLQEKDPKIVVQEPLWDAQCRLVSYQLKDDGRKEDANCFFVVDLVIAQKGERSETTSTVTYVVGTDPVLTVFHAIL